MDAAKADVYLLILGDHLPDPRTGRAVSETDRLRSMVEQAVVAEQAAFTGVAIGEHHFTRYIVSAPELVLAAIATHTTTLRLSTGVTLLAHRDPVRVAEELATLDVLSSGRAELIVARGLSSRTDDAFGVRSSDLRARFDEYLRLLLRLLEERDVTWHGSFRAPLDSVTTEPRPVQTPRPTVWIGSGSAVSADLAAELVMPLMLPSTLRDPASYHAVVGRYREKLNGTGRVALPSHVFVAANSDEARHRWRPHLAAYAAFAQPWRGDGAPLDIDRVMEGAAVCGDPAEVASRLNALGDLLGLDAHLVLIDIGGLSRSEVLDAIRLFGDQVIPRLRRGRERVEIPVRPPASPFAPIETAIAEIRAGRMVVVCDAEDRENEGDLIVAAEFATPEAITFMAVHGRGLICLALPPERCDKLELEPMTARNEANCQTAFTVSVEARTGVSTGISAADRAHTIQVIIDPGAEPEDLVRPGHVFPLRAKAGGVLERTGHTEAAIDLARLAGCEPAGVICEIMNDDGTMARVPDLERYCARHGLTMVTIADLVAYRAAHSQAR